MAKNKNKENNSLSVMIKELKDSMITVSPSIGKKKIPSIIDFMEDKEYLGFKHYAQPIQVYPMQKLILKCFYRGTVGNENITLSEKDISLIKKWGCDDDANGNLLAKWETVDEFRELVLVWGRRSGKGFVTAIIALYEALKLLESSGGNPYSYYGLATAAPFTILTIANSSEQASITYSQIKDKFLRSDYFKDKFIPEGVLDDSIYLLTPQDKIDNKLLVDRGLKARSGSILIRTGHSDSSTLVGLDCYVIIFDEIGLYPNSAGPSSGDSLYSNLTPAVKTYVQRIPILDEKGVQEVDFEGELKFRNKYDGKVICISSPRSSEGIFYKLYSTAADVKHRLMCRLPSWAVNINYTKEELRSENSEMSDEKFTMEFGAVFSGTAGDTMFTRNLVENCFTTDFDFTTYGIPGRTYFAHLDPATSSHNYALVICHPDFYTDPNTKQLNCQIIVDHIKYWSPQNGQPINVDAIDQYMIDMNKRFHFGLVTYDQWNSSLSIQKLRAIGMPAKLTRFVSRYKVQIYDNLERLIISGSLKIPKGSNYDERKTSNLLKSEMIHLQRRYSPTGYKVYPKREGDINTDDCADSLAGAAFGAIEPHEAKLPRGKLVSMPVSGSDNTVWRSMQGIPYGIGSGQSVSHKLEQRSSWPNYKR